MMFEIKFCYAKGDYPLFSKEYRAELSKVSPAMNAKSQRGFAMDGIESLGGPLAEFMFEHGEALIAALGGAAAAWLNARPGRKLKVKFKDVEIEANNLEEVNTLIDRLKDSPKE